MLFDGFSCFMRSKAISFLFILLGLTLTSQHLASAAPQSDNLDTRGRIVARVDYPSDYPYPKKADCIAKVATEADKSLFYTGYGGYGLTGKQLRDYKKQKSLHIVGDSFTYPSGFVNPKSVGDAAKDAAYFSRFADEFSEAMAEKSSGEVFLLLKYDEPANPPSNGHCATTWYRKEFPALKANTAVTKVTQVNPLDFSQTKQIWPTVNNPPRLFKRDDDSQCLDWDQGTPPNLVAPPTGEDNSEDNKAAPSSPAAPYAQGICSFHMTYWRPNFWPDGTNPYEIEIRILDNDKATIGWLPHTDDDNRYSWDVVSRLEDALAVTPESQGDYVQFTLPGQSWRTDKAKDGSKIPNCSTGRWNCSDEPCYRELDCSFGCEWSGGPSSDGGSSTVNY